MQLHQQLADQCFEYYTLLIGILDIMQRINVTPITKILEYYYLN
jgi:hypothetical protein